MPHVLQWCRRRLFGPDTADAPRSPWRHLWRALGSFSMLTVLQFFVIAPYGAVTGRDGWLIPSQLVATLGALTLLCSYMLAVVTTPDSLPSYEIGDDR